MVSDIEQLFNVFFKHIWIPLESLNIVEEKKHTFQVHIQTPDSKILIWKYGKQLDSLEHILKLMWSNITNQSIRIFIKVNDFHQTKDERLYSFIDMKIKECRDRWSNIELPAFEPYQRKKIHDYIQSLENNQITSKSIGEWKQRRMHLIAAIKKISIDIDMDGTDI